MCSCLLCHHWTWLDYKRCHHSENVKEGIAVLGYHGVVSDKEKKENYASNTYFMSVSQFEKQMKIFS